MPKAQRKRLSRKASAPSTQDVDVESTQTDTVQKLNKRQKRLEKRNQWISNLSLAYEKKAGKKTPKKFGDLSEFSSFLDSIASAADLNILPVAEDARKSTEQMQHMDIQQPLMEMTKKATHVRSKKGRKNALLKETLQFQAVLRHPAYKSNPLETIKQHIKNTASQVL